MDYARTVSACILGMLIFMVHLSPEAHDRDLIRIPSTNRNYRQGDWVTFSSTRFIRNIALGDQYVYFATTGGITRLNHFSNRWEGTWTVSNGLANNDVYLVAKDFNTGYLWCVTKVSISYLIPASLVWYNLYFDELGLGWYDPVISIGFSDNRKVYIITENNRWFESEHTLGQFTRTQPIANRNDIVWYGAHAPAEPEPPALFMSEGFIYHETAKYIDDFNLRRFPLTCWIRDRYQKLWIGTWGLGAGVADLSTYRLELLKYGLWDRTVDAIADDEGYFWLGGISEDEPERSGVTEWLVPEDKINYYEPYLLTGFDNDKITAISVDGATVWIGTRDGLTRYDRNKNIWRTYTVVDHLADNRINDITIDDNSVWIATDGGASQVIKSTVGTDSLSIKSVQYKSLGNVRIFDLDQQNNLLWMATEFGIFVYDKLKKNGGFYKGIVGPSDRTSYALSVFDDEIWFGTEEGISAFNSSSREWLDPPARFYKYDMGINRILADEVAVWVATNNGVLKYDREGNRWVTFTVEDGLPCNEVYCLYLDGDYIWFGSRDGLTRFYWNAPYRID